MIAFATARPGNAQGSHRVDLMTDSASRASSLAGGSAALPVLDPRVIGATGGSGTRVVGRIVRAGGMYTGTNLNDYEDALELAGFSDRWINRIVTEGLNDLSDEVLAALTDDLAATLEQHRSTLPPDAVAWGWKEPRSIYLISLFNRLMPGFRFLHFVRDGRDMAFSDNQQQLRKHGEAVLPPETASWKRPVRSIALWTYVNTQAADYGEQHMPGRYLRVRFEDLCSDPVATVGQLYDFFGLQGDVALAAAEVQPPRTLGRWQKARKGVVADLHAVAAPALERFGYLTPG
jgi:hypothetical protein